MDDRSLQPRRSRTRRCLALSGREPAQALVELSLILVFLCGLFIVALDYGRVTHTYLIMAHASREAARIASIEGTTIAQIEAGARNAAKDAVAATAVAVTCNTVTFNSSTGAVSGRTACVDPPTGRQVDTAFEVTVTANVQPVLPFIGFVFGQYHTGPVAVRNSVVGLVQEES